MFHRMADMHQDSSCAVTHCKIKYSPNYPSPLNIKILNRNLCTRSPTDCACIHTGNPVGPDMLSWSTAIRSRRVNFWMYSSATSVKVSKTYWHVSMEIKINSELLHFSTLSTVSYHKEYTFHVLDLSSFSHKGLEGTYWVVLDWRKELV